MGWLHGSQPGTVLYGSYEGVVSPQILKEATMGEWISNNILLPVMYFLIDVGLAFGFVMIVLALLDKLIDNKLVRKIRRR